MRREIEEHFERCIHALEARQQIVIAQLNQVAEGGNSFSLFPVYYAYSIGQIKPLPVFSHSFSIAIWKNRFLCYSAMLLALLFVILLVVFVRQLFSFSLHNNLLCHPKYFFSLIPHPFVISMQIHHQIRSKHS